ncbi:MAG: hypothetical protein K8R11_12540 [Methanococcoides sp.]|nr:hypothetical protein [Methanococcoides sp.]
MVSSIISVEKTCPVCGSKFVVDKSVAERDLCCTPGCFLKSTSSGLQGNCVQV